MLFRRNNRDGYVEFAFIGFEKAKIPFLLNEKALTREANCSSFEAAMIYQLQSGTTRLYLIEWKYTKSYQSEDKYNPVGNWRKLGSTLISD